MSDGAKELVAGLRDFRTRKAAMDSLILMGDEAAPELVEALAHPMENVRWCVRHVLCQIASDAVVRQLMDALDDPSRGQEAARALQEITGESTGAGRAAASPRAREAPAAEPAAPAEAPPQPQPEEQPAAPEPQPEPAPPAPLTDEELVRAAVAGTEVGVEARAGGYVLTVPIARGRGQRVTVSFAARDFEGEPLVVVYTECGPAEAKNHEWALRQNLRMSFGAIGVRDRAGQPTFVMVNTHLRQTVSPDDLRKSVLLLAQRGDALEEMLTKADQR